MFLHVLPELSTHQRTVKTQTSAGPAGVVESEIHLIALAGLAVFYGLERYVRVSRAKTRGQGGEDHPESGVFWDYKAGYDRIARWIVSGAVAAGWLVGFAVELSEVLSEERQSRFLPFAVGAAGYALLLILSGSA